LKTGEPRPLGPGSVFMVNRDLVLRVEDDEGAFLVDPDTGGAQILNQTATSIYQLIDDSMTVNDIVHALADEYSDMDDDAEQQVLETIETLVSSGAVLRVENVSG